MPRGAGIDPLRCRRRPAAPMSGEPADECHQVQPIRRGAWIEVSSASQRVVIPCAQHAADAPGQPQGGQRERQQSQLLVKQDQHDLAHIEADIGKTHHVPPKRQQRDEHGRHQPMQRDGHSAIALLGVLQRVMARGDRAGFQRQIIASSSISTARSCALSVRRKATTSRRSASVSAGMGRPSSAACGCSASHRLPMLPSCM